MFLPGQIYNRRKDIHGAFGGQQQGGISVSKRHPLIFIFTGNSGQQYGYRDSWAEEGAFILTGEGQKGDMRFLRGNLRIKDHIQDGRALHLFESLGKSQGYRYQGEFLLDSWAEDRGPDINKTIRKLIKFRLVPVSSLELAEANTPIAERPIEARSLNQLRQAAYKAAKPQATKTVRDKVTAYDRGRDVSDYVLARANGICELCSKSGPFIASKTGAPFLEAHHIRRLSDGGPDDPRFVAAVCPNCHRAAHYSLEIIKIRDELLNTVSEKENSLGDFPQ